MQLKKKEVIEVDDKPIVSGKGWEFTLGGWD